MPLATKYCSKANDMVVLPASDIAISQLAQQVSKTFQDANDSVADDCDIEDAFIMMMNLVVETIFFTSSRESSEPNGATSKAPSWAKHLIIVRMIILIICMADNDNALLDNILRMTLMIMMVKIENEKIMMKIENKINSQSLEDTQVGYISQKYSFDKYTLGRAFKPSYTFSSI